MTRRAVMSPREQQGLNEMIRQREQGAVARIAHVHPSWPAPGGIPTEADIAALVESTGDPRWVNIDGDAMTGLLTNPVGIHAGVLAAGLEAGSVIAIRVAGISGTGYIGFFPDAVALDNLGSRNGYVGHVSGHLHLVSEAAAELRLGTAGAANRYTITAAGEHHWDGGSMLYEPANNMLRVGPSILESLRISRATNNQPYIAFFDETWATRYGYLQFSAGSAFVSADTSPALLFRTSATERMRIQGGDLLIGKPSGGLTVPGLNLFGTGHIYAIVGHNTATANVYIDREDTAVATGRAYVIFVENNSGVGSITRGGANLTNYNTSSHGPFKGNVTEIDPDEAMDRIMSWRPVAFQWKYDEAGRTSEHGEPSGPVQRGFIAQEHNEVAQSVTPGEGTEDDHREWLERVEAYKVAQAKFDEIEHNRGLMELAHSKAVEDWQAECARIVETWRPVTERETDDGLVIVEQHEPPTLPDPPVEPELPELPERPEDPGPSPFRPWMGDWSQDVPDLAAAVRGLIIKNRELTERIAALEGGAA